MDLLSVNDITHHHQILNIIAIHVIISLIGAEDFPLLVMRLLILMDPLQNSRDF